MPKPKTPTINSRIEIRDPTLIRKLETARKALKPIPALKPFLEMLIEQGLQNNQKEQTR